MELSLIKQFLKVDFDDDELSQEELEALTVAQLRALAEDMNITLTATKKADIIAEILAVSSEQADNTD